jgi:hypothetical protein
MIGALGHFMLRLVRRDVDKTAAASRHWVFAIWLALLVQSMFEFQYAHTFFLLPAALLAGAVIMPPASSVAVLPPRRWAAGWTMVVLALGAAALLVRLSWEYFQLETAFRSARFERANFANRAQHEDLSGVWVLDQLAALVESADYHVAPGMPEEQLQKLHALARRFQILSVRYDYAKALALNGRLNEAEGEMRIIRSAYPTVQYLPIDGEWRAWLKAHAKDITEGKSAAR